MLCKKIEEIFQIKITDDKIFEKALTHPSKTREESLSNLESYERLEFLGDAVLKLCTSENLYKMFPDYMEGKLTKIRSQIVSDNTLARICKDLNLNECIIVASSEKKQNLKELNSICACVFEAVLGAYYLDGKLDELKLFLSKLFEPYINELSENVDMFNAKTKLQEFTQEKNKKTPTYKVLSENGKAHEKVFETGVYFDNELLAVGSGRSKKESEQNAARLACLKLGVINE